jgi:hypothetical protein
MLRIDDAGLHGVMRSRGAFAAWITLAAVAAGAAGCTSSGASDPAANGTFIAENGDFKGYQNWASFSLDDPNPGGSTHVAGKRTIYINHEPPAGASEFPVGTIVVKETSADGKIFAQAKRGGTYNGTGAVGWEWFELLTIGGVTGVQWRGKGPPAGEIYGGDPNAGCNSCHKVAVNNDYVLAAGLMLTPALDGGTNDLDAAAAETNQNAGADAGVESGSDDASHE